MAFQVRKIYPVDLDARRAVGFQIPFSNPAVFTPNYQTKDALKVNIVNYLLTNTGERYLNPTLGTYLQTILFETITDNLLSEVSSTVESLISQMFPKVKVQSTNIIANPDENLINIAIVYTVPEYGIVDEITINIAT